MVRLAGHGLVAEGAAWVMPGQRAWIGNGPGLALCSCGMYSPQIKNRAQRKQWHKDHKADVLQGGTGIVWEGQQ